jgi:hypothetical protein
MENVCFLKTNEHNLMSEREGKGVKDKRNHLNKF